MPDPVSAGLVALRTRLQGINGIAPYYWVINTVEMVSKDWDLVSGSGVSRLPFIGMHHEKTKFAYGPARQVYCDAVVHLLCLLPPQGDGANREAEQLELLDDLFEACSTCQSPGVISYTLAEFAGDANDLDSKHSLKVVVLVRYRRSSRST